MFRMTKKSYNLINIIEEMDKNIKEYQYEDLEAFLKGKYKIVSY